MANDRSMEKLTSFRKIHTGVITFCFTNISTATMEPVLAQVTRPAGRELSPGRCICLRRLRPNRSSNLEESLRLQRYWRRHGPPAERDRRDELAEISICESSFTGCRAEQVRAVALSF